jgi:hypothetical protein
MNKRIIAAMSATVALSAAAGLHAPAAQAQAATQQRNELKLQLQTQGKVTGTPTKKPNGFSPNGFSPNTAKKLPGKPQIKPPKAP